MYRLKKFPVVLLSMMVVVSLPSVLNAQGRAVVDAPDVQVMKHSRSKERVGWERDPFAGPIENFDEMRVRTRNEKRIMDANRGSSGERSKAERDALTDQALIP